MGVGIEAINFYAGAAYLDVRSLFAGRGLDASRFDNLLMEKKSVPLACEDAVSNGVNAAKPIIERLNEDEKKSIQMLITATESGLDYSKSLSNYIQEYLGLGKNCRTVEMKQACYAGTAALHAACYFIACCPTPGAKALVIATDLPRADAKHSYAEPSQGAGAVAMLVSANPSILELDVGASGAYSFEVMDSCRPGSGLEVGDPDLSLLTYLQCLQNSYDDYAGKVDGADFRTTFDYLAFHTPFAGLVKGAHRKISRRLYGMSGDEIDEDFERRVAPGLGYCVAVGNVYSASLFFALCGVIDFAEYDGLRRVGIFSYGSGCCSEFYSGIIGPSSKQSLRTMRLAERLENRIRLDFKSYESILEQNREWAGGVRDKQVDISGFRRIYEQFFEGRNLLTLRAAHNYRREYVWS